MRDSCCRCWVAIVAGGEEMKFDVVGDDEVVGIVVVTFHLVVRFTFGRHGSVVICGAR